MQLYEFFKTPIWIEDKPEFIKSLNKASDKYIKAARGTMDWINAIETKDQS